MLLLFVNKQRGVDDDALTVLKPLVEQAMTLAYKSLRINLLGDDSLVITATVSFVSKKNITELNDTYRGIAQPTDVLSFPMLDMQQGQLITELTDADIIEHRDGSKELNLGDVVMCLEIAKKQAQRYGHSFEREVAFLSAHAALHLIGYDHVDPDEEKAMIAIQRKVLVDMGLRAPEGMIDGDGLPETRFDDAALALLPHAGFVAILGRPNVGKSTLFNALCGMKLSIVSSKPQTTRKNTRVVINTNDAQVIFLDTPGIHKPTSTLSEYMIDEAFHAARDADVLLIMVDATYSDLHATEKEILSRAESSGRPIFLAINKADKVDKESLLPMIAVYSELYAFEAIVPISAKTGDGVSQLLSELIKRLPEGPMFYPEDHMTDQSERALCAELIREQILRYTHQEIPHGTAVMIDTFDESFDKADASVRTYVHIAASILCDRDTHKGIIIGEKGQMLKSIGTHARMNIEDMLGCKIYLDLFVKVRRDWKNKGALLRDLGYTKGSMS